MAQGLIANGKRCRIVLDIGGVQKNLGLATSASYNEDFKLQPAEVLGCLQPVSYDSMGYSCSIDLGVFVPNKNEIKSYADGGEITISDFLPVVEDVWKDGMMPEHSTLSFINTSTKKIINQFQDVMVSSNGVSISGFITNNVKLVAIKRIK